jgi:hypothetical protein
MTDRDTNFDQATEETVGTADQQARAFEMPSCCGPMVERMMKAFGGAPGKDRAGHDRSEVSDLPDWCKSMMARMMKACGGPQAEDGENPAEAQGSCCGEPG